MRIAQSANKKARTTKYTAELNTVKNILIGNPQNCLETDSQIESEPVELPKDEDSTIDIWTHSIGHQTRIAIPQKDGNNHK